jgi:hypothetical protein
LTWCAPRASEMTESGAFVDCTPVPRL